MQHIALESLARLLDEPPSAAEAAHLQACDACRGELRELGVQREMLRALPDLPAPPRGWERLEAELNAQGLIRPPTTGTPRAAHWWRPVLQIAAGLALFVAGGLSADVWQGRSPGASPLAAAASVDEAAQAVRAYEAAYLEALTRYAELAGTESQADPLNRLAALESIVLTTRAALERAPADPVINGYHLTALSQREAMLRLVSRQAAAPAARLADTEDPWF